MKKNQFIAQSFAFIAAGFLAQACGSSTNNVSAVTATQQPTSCLTTGTCQQGTVGTSPAQVYSSCTSYGYPTTVTTPSGNVSVCRYVAGSGELYSGQNGATPMTIATGATSASGGTITYLQLSQGDELEVISQGHYSPGAGVCNGNNGGGDISVIGGSNKPQDPTINPINNLNDGLWFAFESNGQYSTPVNATVQSNNSNYPYMAYNQSPQNISVPMGSTTNNLVMGYNSNGNINCGDMWIEYAIVRCADASGTTYTCH